MTDIIRVNANTKINTGSIELDKYINNIYECIKTGNKAAHEIAINLYYINKKELYMHTGANSFSDFCVNYFGKGISKSQGSRLVKIAEKFLIPSHKYDEYSNTQLIEMLSAKEEMLEYIKPTMTAAEIRKYIKGDDTKKIEQKPEQNQPEQNKTETITTQFEFIPKTDTTPDTIKTANFSLFMAENGKPMLAKILNNIGLNEFTSYVNTHNITIENITIKF